MGRVDVGASKVEDVRPFHLLATSGFSRATYKSRAIGHH